jgi:hypothetical protein
MFHVQSKVNMSLYDAKVNCGLNFVMIPMTNEKGTKYSIACHKW